MDPWAMPQVCQGSKVCGCLGLDNAQLTFLSSEAPCSDGQVVSPQPSLFWDRTSDFGAAALWRGPLVPPLQNTHVSWMVGPEECQAKVPPHPKSGPLASEPLRAPQSPSGLLMSLTPDSHAKISQVLLQQGAPTLTVTQHIAYTELFSQEAHQWHIIFKNWKLKISGYQNKQAFDSTRLLKNPICPEIVLPEGRLVAWCRSFWI